MVENGTGNKVFNGQPSTLRGGTGWFVREHGRNVDERTENLCLPNVLWPSPDAFQFLAGLDQLLPQQQDAYYPSHCPVTQSVFPQFP